MTRSEQLEAIRAAVEKAEPEDSRWKVICADEEVVRLADVLLALGQLKKPYRRPFLVTERGEFVDVNFNLRSTWNLRQDDLSQQSDECVAFLYELLK